MKNIKLTWEQVFPKGLTYVVVNRAGYEKVNIKVASKTPLMDNQKFSLTSVSALVEFGT